MSLIDSVLWRDSPFAACPGLPPMVSLPVIPSLAEQARLAAGQAARETCRAYKQGSNAAKNMRAGLRRDLLQAMVPGTAYSLSSLVSIAPVGISRRYISYCMVGFVRAGLVSRTGPDRHYRFTRLNLDL